MSTIAEHMTRTPFTIGQDRKLARAQDLMVEHGLRHLPVVDRDHVVGVVMLQDLQALESVAKTDLETMKVADAMTREPYIVGPETPFEEVTSTMAEHRYGSAIVAEEAHVFGIFTVVDALRELSQPSSDAWQLPQPEISGDASLANALRFRRTVREIRARKLDAQLLSNLLFAACGVNRVRGPFGESGRTAASASNSQEIDVYVALEDGAYRFDAQRHALVRVCSTDVRRLAFTPNQPLVCPDAPVQLVFVADLDRLEHTKGFEEPGLHDPDIQKSYCYVDTGLIAANVYLFAAAHALGCWFHNCDKTALSERLGLGSRQRVLFAQTVGYPVNE